MKSIFKNITAVLFILLFAFPSLAETVHQFQHKDDIHCRDFSTLHFHAGEHHCSLCDYVPIAADGNFALYQLPKPSVLPVFYVVARAESITISGSLTLSLRGPPVC